jgi:hypothetical protein
MQEHCWTRYVGVPQWDEIKASSPLTYEEGWDLPVCFRMEAGGVAVVTVEGVAQWFWW